MSTLDRTQIATVLSAADSYYLDRDWDNLYQLLEPVSDGSAITGAELGRVYYYLGEMCLGTGAVDAAMSYFEAAVPVASGEWQTRSRERCAEMRRYDGAVDASVDGIAGADEATRALTTAADALQRDDFAEAARWYQYAYDGIQLTNQQVAIAAIGLSACSAQRGEYDDAEGYLQVAESRDPGAAGQVATHRAHLSRQRGAVGLADDGVSAADLDELQAAGIASVDSGDLASAKRYFEQMLASPQMSGTDRGRAHNNLGVAQLRLHEYDDARHSFEEALRVGGDHVRATAQRVLARLDQRDEAWDIVADVELARD